MINNTNEMIALEVFYSENYTVKDLHKVAGYYNISTRKLKKEQLINKKGVIEKVYYGQNTTDHLSFDEIK